MIAKGRLLPFPFTGGNRRPLEDLVTQKRSEITLRTPQKPQRTLQQQPQQQQLLLQPSQQQP